MSRLFWAGPTERRRTEFMNRTWTRNNFTAVWPATPGAENTLVECLPRTRSRAPHGLLLGPVVQTSIRHAAEHHVRAMERPRGCKKHPRNRAYFSVFRQRCFAATLRRGNRITSSKK